MKANEQAKNFSTNGDSAWTANFSQQREWRTSLPDPAARLALARHKYPNPK